MSDCNFSDLSYERCDQGGLPEYIDETVLIQAGYGCEISGCTFENLQLADRYLIGGNAAYYELEGCKFHGIQSSKGILKKDDLDTEFEINDCSGLQKAGM